jgi:phosphatidylglycerophosphate synthase
MAETPPREAVRIHTSVLARVEKALLVRIAERLPAAVNSDHLTVLGALAMLVAGLCYWIGSPVALAGAIVALGVNWFGDSLDGTVARVRRHERPRYGFYVDHVLDAVGTLLVIAGLTLGGWVSPSIAAGFVIAYYLLTIEIALATYAVGTFRISFWRFGPTELRILLAIGTWRLMHSGLVTIASGHYLLFDIGLGVGAAGLAATFIASAMMNARTLYRREPMPSTTLHRRVAQPFTAAHPGQA